MLRRYTEFRNHRLGAKDGEIGRLHDLYFEDNTWAVRYLVADTSYWLPGRLVLLSPFAFESFDDEEKVIRMNLTKQQIESSPPIAAAEPVSRRYERDYYKYYGWPVYWAGPALWGPGPYPLYNAPVIPAHPEEPPPDNNDVDPHLRSALEVLGYHIRARDGEIGHVEDYIVSDQTWTIPYVVVDTRNWLPGKKVLISPRWIENIDWDRSQVAIPLLKEAIETAPEYDHSKEITREYEERLHEHYDLQGYWNPELVIHSKH